MTPMEPKKNWYSKDTYNKYLLIFLAAILLIIGIVVYQANRDSAPASVTNPATANSPETSKSPGSYPRATILATSVVRSMYFLFSAPMLASTSSLFLLCTALFAAHQPRQAGLPSDHHTRVCDHLRIHGRAA